MRIRVKKYVCDVAIKKRRNKFLMIANVNLFTRALLTYYFKKRSDIEFIIDYIYKFKVYAT